MKRQQSLTLKPPTAAEVLLLHDIIKQAAAAQEGAAGSSARAPPAGPGVPMAGTQLSQHAIMHQQDRNQNNHIFGGHLMRMAFEAAFITASRHAGAYCEVVSMADVSFLHPVPIGCIVQLQAQVGPAGAGRWGVQRVPSVAGATGALLLGPLTTPAARFCLGAAQVVYVEGHTIRVHVCAHKQGQDFSVPQITNDFAFAFWCDRPARPVVPETLLEAMAYLAGSRQHKLEQQQLAGVQQEPQQEPQAG